MALDAERTPDDDLMNLDRIRGQRVRFAALPALIPALSGCPVRAVAWLEG
jgi:kynurenine formamidase